jgi:AAA domain
MVYGTSSHREPMAAPPSGWIDMPPTGDVRGHWIPAEGEQARKMLHALRRNYGVDARQIFVISPFRDVADGIKRLVEEFPGVRGGTVHTAQGKESDVVLLFILGGNPARPGAKQWAAQRPNLVNVAVSRARRRIYVIGDQAAWSTCRYFDTLAAQLRDASGRGIANSGTDAWTARKPGPPRFPGQLNRPSGCHRGLCAGRTAGRKARAPLHTGSGHLGSPPRRLTTFNPSDLRPDRDSNAGPTA